MRQPNDFSGLMMKAFTALVCIMVFCFPVSGQEQADYIIMKAKALNSRGRYDEAISLLNSGIAMNRDSRLFIERAESRILQKAYSEAISDLNEANTISAASGEYGLAKVYAQKGDAATSLYHLEASIGSGYRRSEKEIMLDPAFSMIENKQEWRRFWQKERYSYPERSLSEIEYYVSSGMQDEAVRSLADLRNRYPEYEGIPYAESLIDLASGKVDDAVKVLSPLVSRYPSNEKYLRVLARAQTLANNQAGASATYTQLLGSGVADAEILILRADCYRKTGESEKAIADVRKYLDLYPDNRTALSMAGKLEAQSGDNLKAIEYFSENLKHNPSDPSCYVDRADAYFISRSWEWAIKDYSMSLDLDPANPDAWLNKGLAMIKTGRVEDGCSDLRRALNLGSKRASEYISTSCIK